MGVPLTGERYAKASPAEKIVLLNVEDAVRTIRYGQHSIARLKAALEIEEGNRKRAGVLHALNTEIARQTARDAREKAARKRSA